MSENNEWQSGWPLAGDFKKSISRQFSIYISVIIIILMLLTGFIITSQYVNSTTNNVIEKLVVQARAFSGSAGKNILSPDGPDVLMLNNICKKLIKDNDDIYWAGVAGTDDLFLAHTDMNQVISKKKIEQLTGQESIDILKKGEEFALVGDTLYLTVPIEENNIVLGKLGVASTTDQIKEARQMSIITVASISIFMLILGLPFIMFMMHRKLRPVKTITDYLKNVNFDDIQFDINVTDQNEFGYLSETLRVMGNHLNSAQKERIEKERITRELEIAREIQENILPQSFPKETEYEFAGIYKSAKEVGGDYYDFIEFDKDHIGFLIADVSGKSLPGMLVMLLTRDIVRRLAHNFLQPDELLSEVNKELLKSIKKGMFVTMFLGLLNKRTGEFTSASAGHNPLIKLNSNTGKTELIKTNGFPLGMVPSLQFDKRIEKSSFHLSPCDWLIQYTDGINEAQSGDGEEYGMDRFVKALELSADNNPKNLIRELIGLHNTFVGEAEQFDDITLLAMKWFGENVDYEINKEVEGVNAN